VSERDGLLHKVALGWTSDRFDTVCAGFVGGVRNGEMGKQLLARYSLVGSDHGRDRNHNSACLVDCLEWASACDLQ
jgi:hypothetical protein